MPIVARLSDNIGVASWLTRGDSQDAARQGLLTGALIYDVAAAVVLAYAGLIVGMAGLVLWHAVALHAALAGWCVLCLRPKPRG